MKTELQMIETFVRRVCERAEKNMEITHKLEGAHYAAMMIELKQMRLLATATPDAANRCVCDKCGQPHDPKLVFGGEGQDPPRYEYDEDGKPLWEYELH